MILNREEFIDHWWKKDNLIKGWYDDCPLWVPEQDPNMNGKKCEAFVCVKPVLHFKNWDEYWLWCANTLNGLVRCFATRCYYDQEDYEWWDLLIKMIYLFGV